jgi:hypothetical protein
MIDWGALGIVGIVSLAVAVVVVALVALALVGFSAREHATAGTGGGMSPGAGSALGYICVGIVVLITLYGLWLVAGSVIMSLFK